MDARTMYSDPRNRARVRALLGDSTMIRRLTCSGLPMGLWRRLYGTGHEASGQGHYGSGKLQRPQPGRDDRRREPQGDPDLVRVDGLCSHACQYLPQRWAETLEPVAGRLGPGVEPPGGDRHAERRDRLEEIVDAEKWARPVADQQVGPAALARANRPGHGEDLAAEV